MNSDRHKKMDEMERYLQKLIFQHNIREQIMFLLLFILLYIVAFIIILKYQERYNEYSIIDEDEANIYYTVMWVCIVTLAIVWLSGNMLPLRLIYPFHPKKPIPLLNVEYCMTDCLRC